jgi:mRNA interferase MazF
VGKFVKGDIVVLNFPFSNLSGTKRRPALVISNLFEEDIILCQITSRSSADDYSIIIETDDFIDGKLSVESVIRPNKIFTADESIVIYKACKISDEKMQIIIASVIKIVSN